ncbi:Amastin surface glycofamily protein [Leishmania donovani]|uniref:Amastin surface glycofamily protein n=1 Tax=Leishmania donovani TaxID=5661 RepID=A0A504XXF1_LEIDO|nr:Amastin surface glycofamily protein [Leishmania donovani]
MTCSAAATAVFSLASASLYGSLSTWSCSSWRSSSCWWERRLTCSAAATAVFSLASASLYGCTAERSCWALFCCSAALCSGGSAWYSTWSAWSPRALCGRPWQ